MTNNPNTGSVDAELRERVMKLIHEPITDYVQDEHDPNTSRLVHLTPVADAIMQLLTQARKEPEIDHGIDVRNEDDPLKAFDLFIKKWCPRHHVHLVDSDENDGEFMRQKIAQARKGYVPKTNLLQLDALGRVKISTNGDSAITAAVLKSHGIDAVAVETDKLYTQADVDQKVAEAKRVVAHDLQSQIAKYGDGEIVRHNGEAVVPISRVLAALVNLHTPPQEQK